MDFGDRVLVEMEKEAMHCSRKVMHRVKINNLLDHKKSNTRKVKRESSLERKFSKRNYVYERKNWGRVWSINKKKNVDLLKLGEQQRK